MIEIGFQQIQSYVYYNWLEHAISHGHSAYLKNVDLIVWLIALETLDFYYVACVCSRYERALWLANSRALFSLIMWLALWAGKMNQILRCDWLPERARWSYLARSGLPAVSRKKFPWKQYNKSFIDQACSVKMAGYWHRSFLCEFMDFDSFSVHKQAKTELGQYPAILTSHLVSNPYIMPTDRLRP